MSIPEAEFLKSLRATFKVEAAEHLQAIANGLLELEKTSTPEERNKLIANIFRAAHSLKGAARATDFSEIESLCQSMEDRFAAWKRGESSPSLEALDILHRSLNKITTALSPDVNLGERAPTSFLSDVPTPILHNPRSNAEAALLPDTETKGSDETVRITVGKLDALLVQAEEMLMAKLTLGQRAEDLGKLAATLETWRNEWRSVESDARALRQAPGSSASTPNLSKLFEYFNWHSDNLKILESKVAALRRLTEQDRHVVGKQVDDLLNDSKKLLLLPFGTLAAPFPKLVRDLCRDQGKEADFVICGEDVEIDKRILEEMKDPLIHLLRNCVDHGIESSDVRIRHGKPPRATITLAVSPVNGSKVELLVSDDGAGLDLEKVKASAIKHGHLAADRAHHLDNAEASRLIFQAEVSTSPLITRLSGRGLGLAIAREKAEKLGGRVSVESQPGHGTRFQILVPSTLATFRGVLIEVAGRKFVIPTFHIERVTRVKIDEVQSVEGKETIALGGHAIALVWLADVLALSRAETASPLSIVPMVVVALSGQRIAFAVDAVLDELEVLVKPLRKPLVRVRNIAGVTVLGSGQVAPVLNVSDMLKSARKAGGSTKSVALIARPTQSRNILVAEDSITSRMMLRGILESAGYQVKTAVDGIEAFTLLRTEKFDLVVSDVEMPRLNGLDLTARIRADKKLSELPVVLVTTLETREDRERGVEVGANAYIIKSRFDHSDLLDAIGRLI